MARWLKVFLILSIAFIVLMTALGCFLQRPSDSKILEEFAEAGLPAEIASFESGEYDISYIDVAVNKKLPTVLLIHGAPGTFYDYETLLKDSLLHAQVRLIAVDRPGYGHSNLGKTCPSLEEVSQHLAPLLDLDESGEGTIIVGHSYGGPIAARMAADFPSKVSGLVLAAAAVDADNEKLFWFNKPLEWTGLKYLLPRALRVAQEEKVHHQSQLVLLQPSWEKITVPVGIIHGIEDKIVPIENAYFAERVLKDNEVRTVFDAEMSHMIPWESPIALRNMIINLL